MAEHGTFYWNELDTHDPKAACAFYGKALGWTFDEMPMPDSSITSPITSRKAAASRSPALRDE